MTPYIASVTQPARVFNSTKTTEIVTGLTNGKKYLFKVAARNAVGTGAQSKPSREITVGAPGQPPKPTVTRVSSGSLKITFTSPPSNGAAITSYLAACTSSNGGLTKGKKGTSSPITIYGLTAGKTYTCIVKATNSRGTGPPSVKSLTVKA